MASHGALQCHISSDFVINLCVFNFFIAVLGSGMLPIGFPNPVGPLLAEYEPEPTHLDPIHCSNRIFPNFSILISSTNPKLCFTFLASGGFFEVFDLFHELRLPKLVCFVSGRGPGGL